MAMNVSTGSGKSVGEATSRAGLTEGECEPTVALVEQVKPREGKKTLGAHFKQTEARANGLCP